MRTTLLALIIAALLAIPPSDRVRAQTAINSCGDPASPYAEVDLGKGVAHLDLLLARTEAEREQGLMFVQNMPPDTGMLFIYTAQSSEAYWMYHTLIPLSIAWIDHDGTIVDIQDMPVLKDPNDMAEAAQTVYSPRAPYWYALEVNEGWFLQHGVGVGQQMSFCLGGS
ncbi:MAG: DUF192 domain-containing protein [Chloroflexi bacterium]|nr:DUF192 domain-containing protein [Chloroflexota bacterium]